MARTVAALLLAVLSAVAGCIDPAAPPLQSPSNADGDSAAWPPDPLAVRTSCSGFNAILFADAAAMRAHVPPNWTFTAPSGRDELAILRVLVAGCAEGFHLILSTPMHPDEASRHHHDNPDVVLAAYTDNASTVTTFAAVGVPTWNASFAWAETPTGDTVSVTTPDGAVLDFNGLNPHLGAATNAYSWPAAYAAGTTNITWFWGQEDANARPASALQATFGPASPVPGITTIPWSVQVWMGFDVEYAKGTPPESGVQGGDGTSR